MQQRWCEEEPGTTFRSSKLIQAGPCALEFPSLHLIVRPSYAATTPVRGEGNRADRSRCRCLCANTLPCPDIP